jgi:hypothetical protein
MATHAWVISTFTVPTQYSHKMLWLHILGWFEPPQFLHSTATKCYGYTYLGDLNLHSSYTGQPQNVMVTHTWVISTFTVPTEDSHRMLWLHMLWWFEPSQYSHKNVMVTHTWVIWNFTVPTQYSHKMLWLHILGDINLHSSYTVQPQNVIVTHALVIWTSIYLALQPFDCNRVQWRLFQRVVRTKFCIYVLF